jgi:ABC-type cobalt transport system substrate-binding protein
MNQQNDFLDRMRVASPCSVGWESMSGDERVRFCDQCRLHVYNISELTSAEASSLITKTEGQLCARVYRRADGSILTRDCPVGLRALRRRVSKMAGAAFAAVLSLCSGAFGQTQPQEDKKCTRVIALKIKKMVAKDGQAVFSGIVLDEMGAIVPAAKIILINERTKQKLTATSADNGDFKIADLAAGKYILQIEATGFKPYKQQKFTVNSGEALQIDITLQLSGETVTVGLLIGDPQIQYSNGTTVLSGDFIRKLPMP